MTRNTTVENEVTFLERKRTTLSWLAITLVAMIITALAAPQLAKLFDIGVANSTFVEEIFIDIDGDGDLDFIQQAWVKINCGGQACEPADELPASDQPAPALESPPDQ